MTGTVWERFAHDPRTPEHAPLRASDRDRDVVNDVLATAYADGRLTPEELDERSDLVAGARTLGELPSVIDDLVAPSEPGTLTVRERRTEAERRYRQQRQQALFSFLTPTLICWVIWIALVAQGEGTQFPWPVFVTLGTGMRYFQLATSKEDTIVSLEREMEKKERKRLRAQQEADRALPSGEDADQDSPGDR